MITKSTLKALLGGGGVLATWLAVTPTPQPAPQIATPQRATAEREVSAEDLSTQADRLRARTDAVIFQQSRRNPFHFGAPKAPARAAGSRSRPSATEANPAVVMLPPVLTLSGVAEKRTVEGPRRTAVISGDGQIYLVGEGDSVAGQYRVVTIDPEAVILLDAAGTELRLVLP